MVHERVGISAQDAVFGDVVVNWHNTPVVNLYLTTVTLENTTVTNFTNLEFKVFTGTETLLLNERGEIENTTDIPATTKVLAQPRIRHRSFQSPAARHPSVSRRRIPTSMRVLRSGSTCNTRCDRPIPRRCRAFR